MMWIFVAMSVFFLRDLGRRTIGDLPELPNDIASTLQFAVGVLTLRLLSRLRAVPRWVSWGAVGTFLVSVVLTFMYTGQLSIPATIFVLASDILGIAAYPSLVWGGFSTAAVCQCER